MCLEKLLLKLKGNLVLTKLGVFLEMSHEGKDPVPARQENQDGSRHAQPSDVGQQVLRMSRIQAYKS